MDPSQEDEPPPPYNQQDVHGKRTSAGIVAIVLSCVGFGWVGVHKFMLGFNQAGLISLLLSLLCLPLPVFNIISLVEGIIYLTKTDEEFYQLYIVEKKDWF